LKWREIYKNDFKLLSCPKAFSSLSAPRNPTVCPREGPIDQAGPDRNSDIGGSLVISAEA